jgi:hypothetical protein
MQETRKMAEKTASSKGKVDIVLLLDLTGSMQPCIEGVKANLLTFLTSLRDGLQPDANSPKISLDGRFKVVGFRDHRATSGANDSWFVDNPFVREAAELQAQLNSPNMQAQGGGDEPESLMDALYKVGAMAESSIQEGEDANKWRKGVHHCVIFFTDASFVRPMTIPEAAGGDVQDLANKLMESRIKMFGMAPEWNGYNELSAVPGSDIVYYIKGDAVANLGKPGPEGKAASEAAVRALQTYAIDQNTFRKFIEQIGKSVSKQAAAEEC